MSQCFGGTNRKRIRKYNYIIEFTIKYSQGTNSSKKFKEIKSLNFLITSGESFESLKRIILKEKNLLLSTNCIFLQSFEYLGS